MTTYTALKRIIQEEKRIAQKITAIERSLRKKSPTAESLNKIVQRRESALKKYNDSVRSKNKTKILETQKILMDIIGQEIVATQREELKFLQAKKKRVEQDKHKLLSQIMPPRQQQEPSDWDFSD